MGVYLLMILFRIVYSMVLGLWESSVGLFFS